MRIIAFIALFLGSVSAYSADSGMLPNLPKFGEWLSDLLLYIPRKLFEGILVAIADVLNWALGLSTYVSNAIVSADTFLADISGSGVGWWLSWFHVGFGLSILMPAYGIRFLIRRLPFIG